MTELRHSPYQRKKSCRKAKATIETGVRFCQEVLDWTPEEDSLLRDGVCQFGGKNWKAISSRIERRSSEECSKRWATLQGLDTVVKRPWSEEEDTKMLQLVEKYGASKWSVIASYLKDRNGKQCRERWHNQLNPAIKKTPWTKEEDAIILRLQAQLGNCWAKITAALPGRTDNSVKNHWHSSLRTLGKCDGDASLRGHSANVKRCKSKKKLRKVKSVKSENEHLVTRSVIAARESVTRPAASVEVSTISAFADSLSSSPSISSVNSYTSPVIGAATSGVLDDGLLSPDSVSDMDNFDLYMYPCTQTYQEDIMKAQAVIDTILDPMGLGGCSVNKPTPQCGSDQTLSSLNHSFVHSLATWHANDDNFCRSASHDQLPDATSPSQTPFGLDELLFDSLHELCSDELQLTAVGAPNAPSADVAQVYQRSMIDTGITSSSVPSPTIASTACPTYPKSNLPSFSPVDNTLFLTKEERTINADETLLLGKEEIFTGAVTCVIPNDEYDVAQGIAVSATFSSLLDVEI